MPHTRASDTSIRVLTSPTVAGVGSRHAGTSHRAAGVAGRLRRRGQRGRAPTVATTASTSTAPPTVPELLDFTATLSDGSTFVGADLAGTDVLFWFWAPT